jgi:septum formation protein
MVILASQSPRRAELLGRLVQEFQCIPAHIDESIVSGETPFVYVSRLSQAKASTVAAQYTDAVVIAADTAVVFRGQIFNKPESRSDARAMMHTLRGKSHQVLTGLTLLSPAFCHSEVVSTRVSFAAVSDALIEAYLATGEPFDKAGGYALQGVGDVLVDSIQGSVSNVIGLPLHRLSILLEQAGVSLSLSTSAA